MPSFEEARNVILQHVATLEPETVGLLDSVGRVLAEDIVAPWDMPTCSNSAMDGYAIRAADTHGTQELPIVDYVPAGACATKSLRPGTAIKIMTGAPVPEGCDSIVPLEDATESDGKVYIQQRVTLHQHVRLAGEDISKGETVLRKHTTIRPAEVSLLASFGRDRVPVFRKPRVAIVATGDELLGIEGTPAGGKIIDSNSYCLAAAVSRLGATPEVLGIARDNLASHRQKLSQGLKADVLITSAGVSVGDRDLVRKVLAELGVREVFWRVDVKPGKALAFGTDGKTPAFSLPGNPVSTMLTFEEFVAPALLKMMGHTRVFRQLLIAELKHDIKKAGGRTQLARVRVEYSDGKLMASSSGKQDTSYLKTLLNANAIAVLPAERTAFVTGDPVQVHLLFADEETGVFG